MKIQYFFLHLAKNLVLDLWSENLKTNQNARFFKLQYLTKTLSCEVEFFDMTRGPRKHLILVGCSGGCGQAYLNMPKVITNSESELTQE